MSRSMEERIEDYYKKQLNEFGITYYTKTEGINPEIDEALKSAPSKSGGKGQNMPDIKLFIQTLSGRKIPVVIEAKGRKGDLVKFNALGGIDNYKKDGTPNYTNIMKYAVNGAVHYANAILDYTDSYKEVLAIGINGFEIAGETNYELSVYYVAANNYKIPKYIKDYEDLSFLKEENLEDFIETVDNIGLTEEEKELKVKEYENIIEVNLKSLNQKMHDDLKISVGARVGLIAGMIMAGLGLPGLVSPLEVEDLKGEDTRNYNDGKIFMSKIETFLEEKGIPREKQEMICADLSQYFVHSNIWKPENGESKLKTIYRHIKKDIIPIFSSKHHLDFTGKLFNVLNSWVDIPDGEKNDVVLTPRFVTELMVKLCRVNRDSYVWDYATGSAGFLISAMKEMLKDAEENILTPDVLKIKELMIKCNQLLGIEKRSDIYLLAVLNMILMGDGSTNILHKDSLTEYEGKYEQGSNKGKDFPADVFLLNPPYSAPGKGLIFVERALDRMRSGYAAVLIQDSAGSGKGEQYAKNILKNNSLIASIKMPVDLFIGKASVQTAIYVFKVGEAHNEKQTVKFIDMTNDGYKRQNRRKSDQDVNLKDTDHAIERYAEVSDLVRYGVTSLKYFTKDEYVEDTIGLEGNDWNFDSHKKIDVELKEEDVLINLKEYMKWVKEQTVKTA